MSNEKNDGAGYSTNPQSMPLEQPNSGQINEGKTVGRPTPKKK